MKAIAAADRIRESFAKAARVVGSRPVGATVSISVVHCDRDMFEVADLLAQADHALYFAKEHGRNRVELASPELVLSERDEPAAASIAQIAAKTAA